MMLLGKNVENSDFLNTCNNITLNSKNSVLLLSVTLDEKLNFDKHVENLCSTVNRNINALLLIRKFLNLQKVRLLCSAYILSHFNNCPFNLDVYIQDIESPSKQSTQKGFTCSSF